MAATSAPRRKPVPIVQFRDLPGGRRLRYELAVLQEPERARACGSGAKSSADRRPVDPPPVVELHIYDGDGEDITFSYSANFFLFATLEASRPIANGRVQQSSASQQVPVLTGMPVSGMAYLDRPKEAGYFIFPDLSVRHEGMYRLSFNLYEEMRTEGSVDVEQSDKSRAINGPAAPDAAFEWRMEVKSDEFQVFSAKKFPGLAESTHLSRTVAEQGCRVRIRRDVRMRRRESKHTGDFEDAVEEGSERVGRFHEQETFIRERSRSHSAGSDEGRTSYADQQYRQYPNYANPSPVAGHPAPPGSMLNFGSQPQFSQPPPPAPAAQPYQPHQNAYHVQGQPQYRPPPPAPYAFDREHPQSAGPSNPPREHRELEPEYRRVSAPSYGQPPQMPYPSVDANYNRPPYHGYAPRPHSPAPALAPLKLIIEPNYEAVTSPNGPLSAIRTAAPSLPSPSYSRTQEGPSSYSHYSAPIPVIDPVRDAAQNRKRPYDVFSSTANSERLHNGMRPSDSREPDVDDDEDAAYEQLQMEMSYKRANGHLQTRPLPATR